MDEYTGLAKWGLLWLIAGVAIWAFFRVLTRSSSTETSPSQVQSEPEPEPSPPTLLDGLEFPGQPIITHAVEALETTFDALRSKRPADEQAHLFIFLTALVEEAYRHSFPDDLGLDSGNHEAFAGSVYGLAEESFVRHFGPWTPQDEDDMSEDFFDAVADCSLNIDGMWFDYLEEVDRSSEVGAWTRMLRRQHMPDFSDGVDAAAADMIAEKIMTLRP